jgi:hypothetical protein
VIRVSQSFVALGSFAMVTPFSSTPLSLRSIVSLDIGVGVGWRRGLVSDGCEAPVFGAFAIGVEAVIRLASPS